MTSIEKKMIYAMVALIAVFAGSVYLIGQQLKEAGGVSGVVVKFGKGIKDIKQEIDSYEPKSPIKVKE